jgi:hypothetical protein
MLLALREMLAKLARPASRRAGKKRSLASRTSEGALSGDILKPMPFEPARLKKKMGSLGRKMEYGL